MALPQLFKFLKPFKAIASYQALRQLSEKPNVSNKLKKYAIIAATSTTFVLLGMFAVRKSQENQLPLQVENYQSPKSSPKNPDSLRKQFNFIDKVVRKCANSVVFIEIKDPSKMDPESGQPQTISNGSGFIVREDGLILTNAHVVISKPQSIVAVMMHDGRIYNATVEDVNMNIDLALLKINAEKKLPFLKMGNSNDVSTGEWVVALGSPLSLSHSVTAGVISSINRGADELGLKNFSMHYIQTDAAITFGNSGGPLVNLDGDVIGINNLRVTAGIAFAIPVDYAKKFLKNSHFCTGNNCPTKVNLVRRNLGITTISITPQTIKELRTNIHQSIPSRVTHGVLVWKIVHGTPASISDLSEGDIITHVNDFPVHEVSDIYACVLKKTWQLKLKVIRNGQDKEVVMKSLLNRDYF